jgi:exportin-T
LPPSATVRPEKGVPKPVIDYSQFELTPLGQMLMLMIRSNVVSHPHVAASMQVFECVVRYPEFFKIRKECVAPVLEALIDIRCELYSWSHRHRLTIDHSGIHSSIPAVQLRSYYLFHRFIKEQQLHISPQLATTLLERVSDTLSTEAEIPVEEISELSADATLNEVLSEIINHAAKFDAQVSMFEATGTLLSILFRDPEPQRAIFRNLVQPILNQMESGLQRYRANPNPPVTDTQALVTILTLHHDITALGHFAKGFPDMPSNPHPGYIPPPIPIFQQSVEAILVALDTVNHIKIIRDAVCSIDVSHYNSF